MKTFVYIGITGASALLLVSYKGKSKPMETPVPSMSVFMPIIKDITLAKEYPGYLSSQLEVDSVARISGYSHTSYLRAGDRVKRGDLIFMIEPDAYQDSIIQAEASVKTSKAQPEYARSDYERMKEAAKSGTVSQIQVIQAETIVSEPEVAVKNAGAELNTARANLSYCYIRASFDGVVTRASYDIGNHINGAAQPVTLATLYKDDLMFASLNIEDNRFMKMMLEAVRNGSTMGLPTEVLVSIGKDGGNAHTGRLDYPSPNIDLSTDILNVCASLDNLKRVLKSGLHITITLPYAEQSNAVLVRDASIDIDQLGRCLYIVNDSNVV